MRVLLLDRLNHPAATLVRLLGLLLVSWSVVVAGRGPGTSGRWLVVTVTFAACVVAWLAWTIWPAIERGITPQLYVLAAAGGVLCGASPASAASAFVFVAVVAAGMRAELSRAFYVVVLGTLALAVSVLVYDGSALGLLAYTLGFTVAALAASNARQSVLRAEQAELLLAQSQRSHEEQLRAARLEESTRIAREIHDVLAHALAGLTIQLEATSLLLEQGADRDVVLARVKRAHQLAREGLQETRRAVGALRGDPISAPAGIEALVAEYRAAADARAELTIDGDPKRLVGPAGQVVLRVVQEALTNVRKHAPGADVCVALHAGESPGEDLVLVIDDWPNGARPVDAPTALAASGGGYGLRGMHERALGLGGTLSAGSDGDGWHVELRLPTAGAPAEGAR
ncbi:MAG: sensor histidine kinase [Solirubrobacteraceae bacterium]